MTGLPVAALTNIIEQIGGKGALGRFASLLGEQIGGLGDMLGGLGSMLGKS